MSRPLRVAYVGGLGRSGSTLIELCLGGLEAVCAVGELVHLFERGLQEDQLCGCGQAFSACPFWNGVGDVAFGGWERVDVEQVLSLKKGVDRTRYVPELVWPGPRSAVLERARAYSSYYRRIYAAALEISGADVVVDSSKHVSFAACLRLDEDLDLRVVHVVRDSRGVAYSWMKSVLRPEIKDAQVLMPRHSPAKSSAMWMAHNVLYEAVAARGTPYLRVRYEDFARDPANTLASIADFLGLPVGPAEALAPDGRVQLHATHTVAGNPLRFTSAQVEVRADEAWRRELRPLHRRTVSALTAPLRWRYGYRGT